jgi:hypothetical protein
LGSKRASAARLHRWIVVDSHHVLPGFSRTLSLD